MVTSPSDSTRAGAYSTSSSPAPVRRDGHETFLPDRASSGVSAQWGAIVAGAFTGLAAAIIMATLGAAIGLTAGAVAADSVNPAGVTTGDVSNAAVGFGIGAGVWLLLSAIVVGLTGGGVLAKMARVDRVYPGPVLGIVTWACGLSMAVLLAAFGVNGVAAGLGAGASGAVANSPVMGVSADARGAAVRPADASLGRSPATLTDSEREQARAAAEAAAKAASLALWFALAAQLLGLGATVFAASRRKVSDQVALQPA